VSNSEEPGTAMAVLEWNQGEHELTPQTLLAKVSLLSHIALSHGVDCNNSRWDLLP
jgi:hypothetical protein